MKKSIAIYGAGGFGRELRQMLEDDPDTIFSGYFDDSNKSIISPKINEYSDVLFAVADPEIRQRLVHNWSKKQIPFKSFIHKSAQINPTIHFGSGCIICQGVTITVDCIIGDFTIININSVIGHDVQTGKYCSIMPSVNIAGNVKIGDRVFIGAGATILQSVEIGDNAIIGAASLVRKNVAAGTTVVGVPAREIKK